MRRRIALQVRRRIIIPGALAALVLAGAPSFAEEPSGASIRQALLSIQSAALEGDVDPVRTLFAADLVLVSQSGKVYGYDAALFDLGSGFDSWENDELVIRRDGDLARVTFINRRTRSNLGLGEAAFRVLQIWHLRDGEWQLIAQSSARLKT